MIRNNRLTTRLLIAALLLAASPLAFADGTTAGTSVSNQATVTFTVNSNPQTAVENAPATFLVDRLVTFTVVNQDGGAVDGTPNQEGRVLEFLVTNTSNDKLDFALSFDQPTTDDFDADNVAIFVESGATPGGYDSGDTANFIDELAVGASATVYIVSKIPQSTSQDDTADIALIARPAQAASGVQPDGSTGTGTTGALGTLLAETADTATGVETVFASSLNADGSLSATGTYTVNSANISVSKVFAVLSDPAGGVFPSAHPVPGAVIAYCITVANGSGAQPADGVVIADPIPANTTYEAGSIKTASSAVADATACSAAAAAASGGVGDADPVTDALGNSTTAWDAVANKVTTNNGTLAAGDATTTIFEVKIVE